MGSLRPCPADADRWAVPFCSDPVEKSVARIGRPVVIRGEGHVDEAAHAAGARYEVTSCEYDGFGESRGDLQGVDGHRFTCRTKMIDQFTVAAGLDFDEVFTWTVTDGAIIDAVSTYADLNNLQLFMRLLDAWVESEHPGISFTAIEWWAYPRASEVPAVLGVVGEFVASNDAYPLDGA